MAAFSLRPNPGRVGAKTLMRNEGGVDVKKIGWAGMRGGINVKRERMGRKEGRIDVKRESKQFYQSW